MNALQPDIRPDLTKMAGHFAEIGNMFPEIRLLHPPLIVAICARNRHERIRASQTSQNLHQEIEMSGVSLFELKKRVGH